MWEIAIQHAMGVIRLNEEIRKNRMRSEALAATASPRERLALQDAFDAQDARDLEERRHQEHMQAIRDSAPKITTNVYL